MAGRVKKITTFFPTSLMFPLVISNQLIIIVWT